MSALDVSLVLRVSLRLAYRSRLIRICNDMSLSFIDFEVCFQHKCLKVGTFWDHCFLDCYLHQRLVCFTEKLSSFHLFPLWPVDRKLTCVSKAQE